MLKMVQFGNLVVAVYLKTCILVLMPLLVVGESMIDTNPSRGMGGKVFGRRWSVAPSSRCIYLCYFKTKNISHSIRSTLFSSSVSIHRRAMGSIVVSSTLRRIRNLPTQQ